MVTIALCGSCRSALFLSEADGTATETYWEQNGEVPKRRAIVGCDVCDEQHKAARRYELKAVVCAIAKTAVHRV